MSVEAPAATGNMGEPHPRFDARLKVTGGARYASDMPVDNPAYAYLVTSAIARGRIVSINLGEAQNVPGVLHIMTHENTSKDVKDSKLFSDGGFSGTSIIPLQSDKVWHDGQIVAVVVAETYEAAREAGYRVKIEYEAEQPSATFESNGVQVQAAADVKKTHEDPKVGDFDGAFASAEVKVDATYFTPTQHHNPIELFTTTCAWAGDKLTVYEPSQTMYGMKNGIASQLGIEPEQVRVVSNFVGGAFGSKGSLTPRTALTAIAARRVGRPVKLVATRQQGFTIATYRAETKQRVRLGASRDGKLTALSHEGWEVTSRPDNYMVAGTDATTRMYDVANVQSKVSIVHADRNTPGFMRSPPELPYMFGLESAIDELAYALDIDPIELRRKNDTMKEPIKGLPYTSRSVMQCFDEGAKSFGWSKREPKPGSMRDGDWLVGLGCAMSCYPTQMAPSSARVRLSQNGELRVETASHEIGNGAYTVIGQIAAERLGVPYEKVSVVLGDSDYPAAPVSGGSITTASVCNCVAEACDAIRAELGINDPKGDVLAALKSRGRGAIERYAEWTPKGVPDGALAKLYSGQAMPTGGTKDKERIMFAFGAEFIEVRVHQRTREIRVPRIVGAFAAGRIVNPRTARSQLMGGLIWGVSSALHEATEIDKRAARYVNKDLAEYLVPVNADIDQLEVFMIPEEDHEVNPLGIKGIGELGNVGTNAAVANAVYHATGKRIRDLPIRLETLLA
ncbi:MAG: xanthine dehydrogenase family protein molybdopterin-binding subunit [Methylobacteriaceae bacterium]|nr:xanthine dehydrogenase family protein molybdopterin-binding subunit [Methylobacteriaceae bacterium]